ncbi:hypothetical protein [Paenibacillus sp. MZ03-122A]|uniref:hypothetical protein n=1 Tax=Paenibacillus sp. MZ03-122A TaxID=2962033 RepID=UPI0020B6C004|nr:hypothetical protein [Paenibacillus sp. MZ03-122A]MCP3781448.1 hypothetical protein [Paenibacillus sp. MZ03-122A]
MTKGLAKKSSTRFSNLGVSAMWVSSKRLQERVRECRDWKRYAEDDWIIEGITLLLYKATSWDKHRRVCVIRKAKRFAGDQLLLDQPELYWEYDMDCSSKTSRG